MEKGVGGGGAIRSRRYRCGVELIARARAHTPIDITKREMGVSEVTPPAGSGPPGAGHHTSARPRSAAAAAADDAVCTANKSVSSVRRNSEVCGAQLGAVYGRS